MAQDAGRVWFITGCSTGLGHALARRALADGDRVVATARRPQELAALVAAHGGRALALELDVTDAAQREAAVRSALERFGAIDVLVNNAGYGYLVSVEEGEDAAVRAMFETNFFGLAALTRAVLPSMRARRRGHVINISSVGGLVGYPGSGYYAATKFALEGLSEALAAELEPLGLRVTVIEPGPFRTDWAGRSLQVGPETIADYAATAGARRATITGYSGRQAGDPERAAAAIVQVAGAAQPPLHLVLGRSGLERVRVKLGALMDELDRWEAVGLATDFPDA